MVIPRPDNGILKRVYSNLVNAKDFVGIEFPDRILRRLYTYGSLENVEDGVKFEVKNRLRDAKLTSVEYVEINNERYDRVRLSLGEDARYSDEISEEDPVDFPVGRTVTAYVEREPLDYGDHDIRIKFKTNPFGKLDLQVTDSLSEEEEELTGVPRMEGDENFSEEAIKERQDFLEEISNTELEHVPQYSIDPAETEGNIENFVGAAQIPLGIAGPLKINGEHAQGEFPIPLATTEGTLVASYNRGMKAINMSGGAECTVVQDRMNRAPAFVFDSAREAREFRDWVFKNYDNVREAAEETSSVAELESIEPYMMSRFLYLRFNFRTGDAAGQNMVGKATFAGCNWLLENFPGYVENFYLEGNMATDKKASQINSLRTRGKTVTAESVIDRKVVVRHLGAEPESLAHHGDVGTMGAYMAGANSNGAHAANGIAAMFVACGQDEANVAESSASFVHTEVTESDDLYVSITIPSLIVATYGGGTNLPTQRECLKMLNCHGTGNVKKFAEVVAGVCLAGELSLASAISASDWVTSHEALGRNR